MKILLDTHALLWWYLEDPALPVRCYELIDDRENEIVVSAITAWELAIKLNQGKLPGTEQLVSDFVDVITQSGFRELPVSSENAIRAGLLPNHHKDPFDRMLAAQCQRENLPIISNDKIFDHYGVRRIW